MTAPTATDVIRVAGSGVVVVPALMSIACQVAPSVDTQAAGREPLDPTATAVLDAATPSTSDPSPAGKPRTIVQSRPVAELQSVARGTIPDET